MKKNPVINMRKSEQKKLIQRSRDEGILFVTIIFLFVMRDKFGYGKKRLKRLYNEVEKLAESISLGYVRLTDLQLALEQESGITISKEVK